MNRAALLLFVCLCAVVLIAPSVRADGPTLVGKVAEDGTLMALWHKDFLGSFQPIEEPDLLEENSLWVSVYNPLGNGTLTLSIHLYRVRTKIVEYQIGNDTVREEIKEYYNVEWVNASLRTPPRMGKRPG